MFGFKPSNKHVLMTREFYKELKDALDRIVTAIDTNDARQHAIALQQKLRDKFEQPAHDLSPRLSAHVKKLNEFDDPRTAMGKPGIVKLDEYGREIPD